MCQLFERLRLLVFHLQFSHAKSWAKSISRKFDDAQTNVKLKTSQLVLDKIAHMGKHETVKIRSEYKGWGVNPTRGKFLAECIAL